MITRRTFLKAGAAIGAAVAGSKLLQTSKRSALAAKEPPKVVERIPTMCEICFWKCGMDITVEDGIATRVEGNEYHPLSNGMLCPRGTSALGILYDQDRLKKPLIRRKNEAGEQYFAEVSWNEALDFTAKKLQQIINKHGAESIALFSHGHGGGIWKTLMKAMGSGTLCAPSYAQCRGPREMAYKITYGRAVGSPEIMDTPHSKCIAFIGSHLGENMHNTAVQDLSHAIGNGAKLITVDPRFSTVAGKSDMWLPIKPGTDIALILAWTHVLIEEEIYQKDFVQKMTVGFEQLKEHVKDKTPEWAFLQTGIEPSVIRKSARMLARYAPASFVHPGRHVVWYGDDTQRVRAIGIINGLLGNWGKKGGFYLPAKYPMAAADIPHPKKYKVFPLIENDFPLGYDIPAQTVMKSSLKSKNKGRKTVKSWIAYGCNLPLNMPDPVALKEAMNDVDFILAIDILPAEITGYADVVFPECTFLERYDAYDARENRVPYVAIRQPAVRPMYDSKPGYWMARELAKRITVGGETLEKYFPHDSLKQVLKEEAKLNGFSFEEISKKGALTQKHDALYDPDNTLKLNTPSGKVELYSKTLADAGLDPLPNYTPPEEPPPGYFRLLFGRSPLHTFSRTTNNSQSMEIFGENELWLNVQMAKSLGIRNGNYVELTNQDGLKSGSPVRVKVTQRIRQDCVYMVHGFGRADKRLTKGYHRGASDTDVISRYKEDPVMGGTGMNVNFVSLNKVDSYKAMQLRRID
ncbi:MAG: molybdopterin-dependent oxidoreductase [Leptospiraceae bacterium]|nr:molybdopterin-dependent oxidoreductase [Leptospiraceae bacterium]